MIVEMRYLLGSLFFLVTFGIAYMLNSDAISIDLADVSTPQLGSILKR